MTADPEVAELGRQLTELGRRTDKLAADFDRRIAALERQWLSTAVPEPSPPTSPTETSHVTPPEVRAGHIPPPEVRAGHTPPPPVAADAIGATVPPPPMGPVRTTGRPPRAITAEDVLRLAGVSLVGLAAIFLVSTAISRGWIGPELQLLGATAIGFGLLGTAVHLAGRARAWAISFGVAGAAVVTICAGAAYGWLELVGPEVALLLVAVTTAISTAVAARLQSESVAIAATAAMLLVPPFARIVADGSVPVTGVWLALFAVAATVVGHTRGWPRYRLISTWSTALWTLGLTTALSIDNNTDHVLGGSLLVGVVGAVLWLGPVLARGAAPVGTAPGSDVDPGSMADVSAGGPRFQAFELRALALIPVWAWSSVVLLAGLEARGDGALLGLAMAAGFGTVALAGGFRQRLLSEFGVAVHLMGAGLLLTISLMLRLDGPVLVVALAAQGLITIVVAKRFGDRLLMANGVLLSALSWLLVGIDLLTVIERAIDNGATEAVADHLARAVTVGLLAIAARATGRPHRPDQEPGIIDLVSGAWWIVAMLVPISMVSPVVDGRLWLVVGTVAALAGVVAAPKLGPVVLAITAFIGVVTAAAAGIGIVDTTARLLSERGGVAVSDHLSHLVVVVAAIGLAAAWWNHQREAAMITAVIVAWGLTLGWLASVLATTPQAQVAISAAWALAAGGAIVAWVKTGRSIVRVLGFATLTVVLVKLLTVDLAEVETLWRVGLFLVIGLGLLRLGYVLPSLAGHNRSDDPEQPA